MNLFAFWKYDQFPFVLGGEATIMNDDGTVYVPAYQGTVRPVKMLPVDAGKKVKDDLDKLTSEYSLAMSDLTKEFKAKRDKLIKL
jgi:hypothetical protein